MNAITCVSDERKLVNSSDNGGQLIHVVLILHHILESPEHGGVHLSIPLYLVLPILYHNPQICMFVHPLE